MSKRDDIKKILIIGAGPIVIGQACEFDYSGTQACKALKEEGYTVILVNSNPATIMTDPMMADKTYIEPLTVEVLTKIIEKERPCALLPTVGGQTALNVSLALHEAGVLEQYKVEMIGATPDVIHKAEDRGAFKEAMKKIGLASARSEIAYTMAEAKEKAVQIGYPVIVRPAFTLGGTGGGIAYNQDELLRIVEQGLMNSIISEVLLEESIIGWKEFELEVMRDKKDNVVIVCSIENIDPMGVHTGDSITVAPAQTLTDRDYQTLRDAAIAIVREIGVNTGGANVQFAVNPKNGDMIVIEMNPRVSRSSALASKATGFPIAKLAAKLSVGYTLDELNNDITRKTPACFEPALDYCVVKIPRFDNRKFSKEQVTLGTSMKSVGEAMAIGRTFKEAFQKGVRSLELGRFGFGYDGKDRETIPKEELEKQLSKPHGERLFYIQYALKTGMSVDEIHRYSGIDPWFLYQFLDIVHFANNMDISDRQSLLQAKRMGFSDQQLAIITRAKDQHVIRDQRRQYGIVPTYLLVDTCAAEFEAYTPYYYSTYETEDERRPSTQTSVMILGSGPNRIGQGIEFDYCCVHASFALRESSFESIMVNSNPETVSTDFDSSDKLFFEPLTLEDVLNIYEAEKPAGVIVQFGGQTPLNLVLQLQQAGVKILGTSPDSIDCCEDRDRTKSLLTSCGVMQPPSGMASSVDQALTIAQDVQYPVLLRPSYVIGGTAMQIVANDDELKAYMDQYRDTISDERPILIDKYLDHAVEVDVDCLSDGHDAVVIGILQHIEPAGIHSGDSACVFPPFSISSTVQNIMRKAAKDLAKALNVVGLLNVQFAIKDDHVYVLEVNPRASRTVPFICKASGVPWIKLATKIIMGKTLKSLNVKEVIPPYYAVKEAVFPFNKFENADILLSPEMKSTGEVMGIDYDLSNAFIKSQVATGQSLTRIEQPRPHAIFVSVNDHDKQAILSDVSQLQKLGIKIYATEGTKSFLEKNNVPSTLIYKTADKQADSSVALVKDKKVDVVINTVGDRENNNEKKLRRVFLDHKVPFISTVEGAAMYTQAMVKQADFSVRPIQSFYADIKGRDAVSSDSDNGELNLFVRQSFTESTESQSDIIQAILDQLVHLNQKVRSEVHLLTGETAYHKENFKQAFEDVTGTDFTPQAFRSYRLSLLDQADAFIIIRTAMSESSVFELTYNIYQGRKAPVFFAIHEDAPIKTTLLKDLQDLVTVRYCYFKTVSDLQEPLLNFLKELECG